MLGGIGIVAPCWGEIGDLQGAEVAPVAYLASTIQASLVQDDFLVGWDVPVIAVVQEAMEAVREILPGFLSLCWKTWSL